MTPAAARMPRHTEAVGAAAVDTGVWAALACALMLTLVVLPSWTNAALRKSSSCLRAAWEFVTGSAGSRKERRGVKQPAAGAGASKPRIDIPAEAFRAAGRSVLRNSAISISSPISSCSSSTPSAQKAGSLDRAREVLLMTSSADSSAPSGAAAISSSVDSCDLLSSVDEPLTSVMELENFRKSLGDEHAHIVEHSYGISKLGLDASWVLFENEDEKDFDEHRPRSKAPRISDMSAAATEYDRRSSIASDGDSGRERQIGRGWLAVEGAALAASAPGLDYSLDDC